MCVGRDGRLSIASVSMAFARADFDLQRLAKLAIQLKRDGYTKDH
jgi:hypothetical protein